MNKNNVDTQIEGGLILINNLQCIIKSEKVERKFANIIKSKFLLRDSEKIQFELEFNGVNKRTTPSSVTSSSDNTIKKVAWDEHIHFDIGQSSNVSKSNQLNELIITGWNTSVRGFDGCLGVINENLANYDKFDNLENRIKFTLRDENPKIEISYNLYFLSNNPPPEMEYFDDLSIRNRKIGMMLINNIKYQNVLGHNGSLEFELQVVHSTAEYWQTTYSSSQQQKQSEWKYVIAMFMIARPDKMIIRFKHGTRGCAEVKISIGPAGEMEFIWPKLMKGGPVNVGDHSLMENGCIELNITFDLSCHSIVTSKHIFGGKKDKRKSIRKPPPPPPPRRGLSFNKLPSDQNINHAQGPSSQEYHNSEQNGRQRSHSLQEYNSNYNVNRKVSDSNSSNNNQQYYNEAQESNSLKSLSYERSDSFTSSKTSRSSKQKKIDKHHSLPYGKSSSRQDNDNFINVYHGIEPTQINEEEEEASQIEQIEQDSSRTSQTSSSRSQNHSSHKKSRSLNTINKGKYILTSKNMAQHVKLGCSPPFHDFQIDYEDFTPNSYIKQPNSPTTSQANIRSTIHQIQKDTSQFIYNKYELTYQLQKPTHNKVYLGRHIHTSDVIIVKLFKSYSRWENETCFLKALTSKMVVKLEDISLNPVKERECFIITRYFGKSLDEIAEDICDNKADVKNVLLSICKAIEWCHSKDVVHMDLNPSNIICKHQKIHKIQLCDFEHSKNVDDHIYSDTYSQPLLLGYTSPELILLRQIVSSSHSTFSPSSYSSSSSSTYYTTQSSHVESLLVKPSIDIFSLGCIFYYLNTKNLLYNSERELEQLSLTKVCEDIEDEQVSILVKWMVAESGSERPNITQVLENSFFKSKDSSEDFL
ncbi:hypothetical protein C1645_779996 [Glomus cerebriforme]|uniref:Protein kinase domain-containing protein n=1 Tax=Glomus cerebriforme TaxID=658196 RepID=A0A397SQE6_9GLOM|nr:hypothetical protein C1645_779996 [Glomus cerebriforme]